MRYCGARAAVLIKQQGVCHQDGLGFSAAKTQCDGRPRGPLVCMATWVTRPGRATSLVGLRQGYIGDPRLGLASRGSMHPDPELAFHHILPAWVQGPGDRLREPQMDTGVGKDRLQEAHQAYCSHGRLTRSLGCGYAKGTECDLSSRLSQGPFWSTKDHVFA